MKINRILVPVDYSPGSLQALKYAADLAKPLGAELLALAVVEPILFVVPDYAGAQSSTLAELINEQRRAARAELARLERRYAKRGVRLRPLVLIGRPSTAINETATRLKADLIIMATHGRTGVSRLLMGSVTERVVRTATCPVLTLRTDARPRRAAARRRRNPRRAAASAG